MLPATRSNPTLFISIYIYIYFIFIFIYIFPGGGGEGCTFAWLHARPKGFSLWRVRRANKSRAGREPRGGEVSQEDPLGRGMEKALRTGGHQNECSAELAMNGGKLLVHAG